MNSKVSKTLAGVILAIFLASPLYSAAQTINYQPRTNAEMIAYLYGRISQLLDIQRTIESGGSVSEMTASTISIETHSATEVEETTAYLRGEVNLFGEATASAWFEYGQDDDFLDQKTRKTSVRTVYDRAIRTQVRSLEDDERYYFRIAAQDNDGAVRYGEVYGFRTDETED